MYSPLTGVMASAVSRSWSTWLWILSAGSVEPDVDRWGTSWRPSGFKMWCYCLSLLIAPGGNPAGKNREEMISITCVIVMMLVFSWRQRKGFFFYYFHSIQKVIISPDKINLSNEGRCTERKRWSAATIHSLNSNSKVEVFHFFIRPLASQIINHCGFMPNLEYWHFHSFSAPKQKIKYTIALIFTQRCAEKCKL